MLQPRKWGENISAVVTFTFDVDGETLWLSRDPENARRPGVLSQGRYGPKVGVPLILDLLDRNDIKATFFVPGWIAERNPDMVKDIHGRGHEVGHHGYLHEWINPDKPDEEDEILKKGVDILQNLLGSRPVGYRSPAWEFSDRTLELLQKHGFEYSTNMMDSLWPYMHPGTSIVELPVQWMLDDAPFFMFSARPPQRQIFPTSAVLQVWQDEFRGIHELGGLYNMTNHPQFIGRPSRLAMLQQLIDYVRSFSGVLITTASDAARRWREAE